MMSASTRRIASAALVIAVLVSIAAAQQVVKGRFVTDHTEGFRMVLPGGFVRLPINIHERRVLGWFQSEKRYFGEPAKGDSLKGRHAAIKVVKLQKPAAGKWRYDYERYLAACNKPGTYECTKSKGRLHGAIDVVKWDVRIAGPGIDRQHVVTWVFAGDRHDVAVECQMLEAHHDQLLPSAERALESFSFIPAKPREGSPFGAPPFALHQWRELPVLERHRRRQAEGAAFEKLVRSRLPEGWAVQESDHFLVVSDTEAKVTKHVHALAMAFHEWLDERFGGLSDEYPIRTTIRICKNASEYYSYRAGGWHADYAFGNREVVVCDDRGSLNTRDMLWGLYHRYMLDAAPEVCFNTPPWLSHGLRGLFSRAQLKGRKLTFPPSTEERTIIDDLRRSTRTRVRKAAELMLHPDLGYKPDEDKASYDLVLQSRLLLRFLDGPAKRCRALHGGGFLGKYVRAIREVASELDAEDPDIFAWDSEDVIRATLEARRDAAEAAAVRRGAKPRPRPKPVDVPKLRERWSSYKQKIWNRRVEFVRKLHARACGWTPAEWEQLERGFERFCRDL